MRPQAKQIVISLLEEAAKTDHYIAQMAPSHAAYYYRNIISFIDSLAIGSTELFSPSDPEFGSHPYANILFEKVPQGLSFTKLDEIVGVTGNQLLILAAYCLIQRTPPLADADKYYNGLLKRKMKLLAKPSLPLEFRERLHGLFFVKNPPYVEFSSIFPKTTDEHLDTKVKIRDNTITGCPTD